MRIGVIGAGRIGRVHAGNLAGLPGVHVVLGDVEEGRAQALADEIGADHLPTVEDLLAAELDGVVIAAATDAHPDLILAAADAGLPTLCEKPISLSLAVTDKVVRHVERARTVLDIGFQRRHDPAFAEARSRVADGRTGKLYVVRFAGHDAVPPPADYVARSGGIFLDLHLHDFDIVRWVTGQEVDEVYVDGSVLVDETFATHDDVDTTVAVLRLSGGTLAVISGGRHDAVGYDHRMEIIGSADSVSIGLSARTPLHALDHTTAPEAAAEPWRGFADRFADAYRAEAEHFVRVVAGEAEPRCTAVDARRSMAVALAAERSRQEHRPVRIAEIDGHEPGVDA